nr:crosslink repair DNA glycosylase YcaQ family protein [Segeticoccus rhizosphaerae]
MRRLTRAQARRIAVRAQLLSAPRPRELLDVLRHLTLIQVEPTAAVVPSAELVAWSRLGNAYRVGDLDEAVSAGRLVELEAGLQPVDDLPLHRAEMELWRGTGPMQPWQEETRDWVAVNDDARREILAILYDDGPLPTSALPDATLVPWESSGWNNNRSLRVLLHQLVRRGEVALAGRDGRDPLWDLAERVYPDGPTVPLEEAMRIRSSRQLHSLGLARVRGVKTPREPHDLGPVGEPAVVEGTKGQWRLDPSYLDGSFRGRTVLLSPLDRLVFDRERMADLFEFDYQLEMYKPVAKRRWGYWAMPVLHGDRLVGKVDATADRRAGVLRVGAIHEDVPFTAAMSTGVAAELDRLARWLGLDLAGDWVTVRRRGTKNRAARSSDPVISADHPSP